MAAANNEFFEALSMLEHERGITAEYLIDKIKAAIVIAVKKNYEVEDNNVMVEIDPASGKFNVALIQDVVADEDWYDEHSEIGITEAQNIRKDYKVGDRVVTPLKTKDFGRIVFIANKFYPTPEKEETPAAEPEKPTKKGKK